MRCVFFLLKKPVRTDLSRGEMFSEDQVSWMDQKGTGGNPCTDPLAPRDQFTVKFPYPFRLGEGQVSFFGNIRPEVEEFEFFWPHGVEVFNQLPVSTADCARGNSSQKVWPVQWIVPVQGFSF